MRAVIALVALLMLVMPAEAAYEEVGFTRVFDDEAGDSEEDADILSLDIGEPGDGTLIFAVTVAGSSLPAAAGSIDLFLDNGFRNGWNMDGACDSIFSGGAVDGNTWYCALSYDNAGAVVGAELTGILMRSYVGIVQDYAPGPAPAVTASGSGTYLVLGCTLINQMMCPGAAEESTTFYANLTEPALAQQFANATSDTHVLNFTTAFVNGTANVTTNGTGNVTVVLTDDAGTEWMNQTLMGNDTVTLNVTAAGGWVLHLVYDEFVGTLDFALDERLPPLPVEEPEQNETMEPEGNTTEEPGEDSPALPLVVLVAGLVVLAARRR